MTNCSRQHIVVIAGVRHPRGGAPLRAVARMKAAGSPCVTRRARRFAALVRCQNRFWVLTWRPGQHVDAYVVEPEGPAPVSRWPRSIWAPRPTPRRVSPGAEYAAACCRRLRPQQTPSSKPERVCLSNGPGTRPPRPHRRGYPRVLVPVSRCSASVSAPDPGRALGLSLTRCVRHGVSHPG